MKNLRQAAERLLFGATTEELKAEAAHRTELIGKLIDRRVEQRLARLVEALAADEDDEPQDDEPQDDEQQDDEPEGGAA